MRRLNTVVKPRVKRVALAIAIVLSVFLFCTFYFRKNIVPTVMDSSIATVRSLGTNALNSAATSVVSRGVTYADLFTVIYSKDNEISMIQANSPSINGIARQIANLAQANLDELGTQDVNIAFGTFTGLALLQGFGPDVTIKIIPIGAANCDFVSQFVSAGINQTLHKIYIDVYADISIITPLDEPTVTVKVEVLVCENLIVGQIPEVYLTMSDFSDLYDLSPSP